MEHLPQRCTLVDSPAGASLIDRNDRVVRVATGTDRLVLSSSAISSAILPQYLRSDPLGPDWTLPTGPAGTVSSTDLRGQVAYLFFWASWCPTCHSYLPEVQKIHDDYEDVQVLAVNAYDRDDALRYIRDIYFFEVALRGDALLGSEFQFVGLPALVIPDRNGVIRHRELAPRIDQAAEIQSLIRELVSDN